MVDIPGDSSTGATITVGGSVDGSLEINGDHDWYRLQLTAGQQVTILLAGLTLEDPYLRIRDSAGNLIFESDDISAGVIRDSRVSFTAPSSGTFFVDVGAWDENYAGTYQLSVQPYTPPPEYSLDEVATFLADGYWGGDRHAFDVTQGGSITVNVTALTPAGQNLALQALDMWSDIIGVSFVPVTTDGQITFDDNAEGAFAEGVWANGITTSAHVNVSADWLLNYGTEIGGYAFQAYVHEVGHALGLGHAGYYNVSADYFSEAVFANDGWPTSIMSYFDQNDSSYFADLGFSFAYLATPMIGDIAAMQLLYGLSTTTRTGNTTYGYNSNAGNAVFNASLNPDIAYAIFDSGGIDTIDYSGASAPQTIDLTAGSFSNVGGMIGNVSIANGVVIERAVGGSGRDLFILNAANNRIDGGAGEDTVSYATATAGVTVNLGLSDAQKTGGAGTDTLLNIEYMIGSSFDDVLTASSVQGNVWGGDGDDVMTPGAGIGNGLYGEAGDDLFISGPGDDLFDGGEGFDTVDYSAASSAVFAGNSSTEGSDMLLSIERVIGSDFDDRFYGTELADQLIGGAGNDEFWLMGSGPDVLTGGSGSDTFLDSRASFNGDTITDFTAGDRIVFSDADLSVFTFSLFGSALTYSGGTLILSGGVTGTLVAAVAPEGGVQLTLSAEVPPPAPLTRAKLLLTETGQDFEIGGNVMIFGTTGAGEEISIVRGDVMLDASFNIGGDRVVLPGAAGSYTATLSGSFVTIANSGVSIAIPVGVTGLTVEFSDAERTLRFDPGSGQVLLGDQAVTGTSAVVAESTIPFVGDGPDGGPASTAKLLLTEPMQDIDIGGNVTIFGTTTGGEVMTLLGGTIFLDASFNTGRDTVVLPGAAGSYTAVLAGSFVTIAGDGISVAIPLGVTGLTVEFADTTRTLWFDINNGAKLGDQVIGYELEPVEAEPQSSATMAEPQSSATMAEPQPSLAMPAPDDSTQKDSGVQFGLSLGDLAGPADFAFAPDQDWGREWDYAPAIEPQRFELSDSFYLG